MKIIFIFSPLVLFIVFFLQSCASCYYCNISSFGNHPQSKTYYLLPEDSLLIDDLEYIEYAGYLTQRLNEIGYIETVPENSEICIKFSYFEGDKEYERTTTTASTNTINLNNGKIVQKGNASANATTKAVNGKLKSDANAKTSSVTNIKELNHTFTSTNTSSVDIYSIPIECNIIAYSTKSNKIVWKLKVTDKYTPIDYYNYSLRKFMPWMILSAQPYMGTNAEVRSQIKLKEGLEKGLKDPSSNY